MVLTITADFSDASLEQNMLAAIQKINPGTENIKQWFTEEFSLPYARGFKSISMFNSDPESIKVFEAANKVVEEMGASAYECTVGSYLKNRL